MFKILGVLVGLYTAMAVVKGEVYAKSGVSGRTILKGQEPRYFLVVIAIYSALSLALLFLF